MIKVNPKIDLVFKKLFGSEENKDILMSLINAILPYHQQIAKLSLKNPYNVSDYAEGKLSILDIKAEDEKGIRYDIEMQIKGTGFYGKRTLYYWAKMFGSQLDYTPEEQEEQAKGAGYPDLKKCIVISLMDFNFFDDAKYHRFFTLKDGQTNEIHKDLDYLDLYFIELKKSKKQIQPAQTILERWISFLNNAYRYTHDTLPKELAEIKEIRKASAKLDVMYLDENERNYFESQQKFWLDENTRIRVAVEKAVGEAVEKAVGEAVEKAVGEAEIESKLTIAKNAILAGLTNEFIAQITGLTIGQIEALRNK